MIMIPSLTFICAQTLCFRTHSQGTVFLFSSQFGESHSLFISSQFSCLLVGPWIAARHASLSITNSWSSLKLMFIESVMPSSHLILCRALLLLPPIAPSIRVFSNESTLHKRWPKYWSFSFSILPKNTQD